MTRSLPLNYDIAEITDSIIYILNFTEDIQNIAKELKQEYPEHRIVFRTSISNWDELLNNGEIIQYARPLKKLRADGKLFTAKS